MVKRFAYFCFALLLCITFNSSNAQAEAPTANAGIDLSAFEGTTVTLNGSASFDPEAGELIYLWQQVIVGSEPDVELLDANTALPSFIMPASIADGNQLTFTLDVTDPEGLQSQDTVIVTNAAQIDCDVAEGFHFTGANTTIGHITVLEIGGTELVSDLVVTDPENPETTTDVVGVLESINWNNLKTDPLRFIARLSDQNKTILDPLLGTLTGNEQVLLKFSVFTYNSATEAYYESFHTNSVIIAGLIDSVDSELQISLGQTAESDVPDPANFTFSLDVAADTTTTHLLHRTDSLGLTTTWLWGDIETDGPTLETSAANINFGIVSHGSSPSQSITIENTGTTELYIGTVGEATPLTAPFIMTDDTCSEQVLGTGEGCSITVKLDASLIAAVILPATGAMGTMAAGLVFFGAPGRRNRIMRFIMMAIAVATLFACAPDRDWYTGAFDIPSNDPSAARTVIGVMADVEEE